MLDSVRVRLTVFGTRDCRAFPGAAVAWITYFFFLAQYGLQRTDRQTLPSFSEAFLTTVQAEIAGQQRTGRSEGRRRKLAIVDIDFRDHVL